MTVVVYYTRFGDEESIECESEQQAGIFMDGLAQRDECRFQYVDYPDERERNAGPTF
jgi:hypothetical protein